MEGILFQVTIFLAAAVIAVPLAARLGLGSVLGYLAAGLLIGPALGLIGDTTELQHVAEFGVVMMLFLIGLELDPRTLWDMRHRLVGLGALQILLTAIIIAMGAIVIGTALKPAIAIGLIFALSSTAIVLQTLSERGLMQTKGGRSMFSVLLAQDIAVIPMLILLPLLATRPSPWINPDGSISRPSDVQSVEADHAMSLVAGLPNWGATLVTLGVIAGVILAGIYLVNPVFRYIHTTRLREMYTALALLIVIGIAFLMTLVGLSPALGTFLAGVVLANSEFRHELESDIDPFKGLLLRLFFITVGAGLDVQGFLKEPLTLIAITLALMLAKGAVLYILGRLFQLQSRDQWLFTLGLAQAGEFGLLLFSFSAQQQIIPAPLAEKLLTITALSMLLTPLFFLAYSWISRKTAPQNTPEHDEISKTGRIIIAGVGRFGQAVNRMVQMSGFDTVVLDHDLETIKLMRSFGIQGYFGDPTRPSLLKAAGLETADILVVALDDRKATVALVAYARRLRPDLHIVARARDRIHVYALRAAGANDIVRELFDSSLRAARYVLENIGLTEFEAANLEKTYFDYDRAALLDLADLWKPGVPIDKNPAYMKRTKELHADLEAALLARFEEPEQSDPKVS